MTDTTRRVARIGKAHGLRGEVTIHVFTDQPEQRFVPGASLVTAASPGSGVPKTLTVATARKHREIWLLGFEGIADRTGAQGLRGTTLSIKVEDDSNAEDDAWYDDQLIGLRVENLEGVVIGRVSGLLTGPAQDVLEIALEDGREAMIPFVAELVPRVDPPGGVVVIDPPDGIFDL